MGARLDGRLGKAVKKLRQKQQGINLTTVKLFPV